MSDFSEAAEAQSPPLLSVVVTITSLSPELGRCLQALARQRGGPATEILVPYDPATDDVADFRATYPWVRFIAMSPVPEAGSSNPGLAHLKYDHRRTAGLLATRGALVAITEDRAIPAEDWCATIVDLHREPYPVIGGAIENASRCWLNQAVYCCDFMRYQNPLREGPAEYVSDVNVSYKRVALQQVRPVWSEFYHETAVHAAIRASGGSLWLSRRMVVLHDRGRLRLPEVLRERLAWARLFAGRRALSLSPAARLCLAALCPALPLALFLRRVLTVLRTRHNIGLFASVSPLVLFFLGVWACGEFLGYVTRRPISRPPPRARS